MTLIVTYEWLSSRAIANIVRATVLPWRVHEVALASGGTMTAAPGATRLTPRTSPRSCSIPMPVASKPCAIGPASSRRAVQCRRRARRRCAVGLMARLPVLLRRPFACDDDAEPGDKQQERPLEVDLPVTAGLDRQRAKVRGG